MAGNTAAANLEGFVFTSMNAVTQAAMTFVGQNVGAGEPTRVRRAALQCLAIVCGVGLVMGNTFYLCGGALLSLYRPGESAVIAAGLQRMALTCIPYCTCGAMDTGSGILRGMGQSTLSMVVTLLGSCALRIVWIYTVCPLSPEIQVLYLSYPVSWTLTAAVLCLCCIRTYRKSIQSRAIKRKQPV